MDSGQGTIGSALGAGRRAIAEEVPVGYKQTEVGVIPTDWIVTRLGGCGEIIMGQSPPGTSYNQSGVGSPLINGPTEFTELHPVKVQWTTQPARFCKPGDLLICVRGSSTGRTNYADEIYAIGRGVAAIRAKADNDTQYLSYQVISGVSDLLAAATGSTFPSVDGASFRKILVLLPSPAEQRAIAETLSDVDGLLAALEVLIAKKRAVKQAAMQQLLTGKTRLPGFSGEWETKRLGEIAPLQRGFDLPTSQIQPGSYAVVYSNGVLQHHERAMVKGPGVVTGRSGTIGKVHFIEKDYWPHNTALWVTSFRENDPKFIYYLYTHINLVQFLSGSGVPTLNRNDVHQHLVACPPHPEQRAIAAVLSDMDAEIAALERRRDKTRTVKQGMMQQLLTGRVRLVESEQSWR